MWVAEADGRICNPIFRKAFHTLAGPPKGTGNGDRSNIVDLADMRRLLGTFAAPRHDIQPFPHVFVPSPPGALRGAAITDADLTDIEKAVRRAFAGFQVWAGTVDGHAALGLALDAKHAADRAPQDQRAIDRVLDHLVRPTYPGPKAVAARSGSNALVRNGPDETVLPHGVHAAYLDDATGQGVLVITADLGFRDLQLVAQMGVGIAIGAMAATQGVTIVGHAGRRLCCALRGDTLPFAGSVGASARVRIHGVVHVLDARHTIGPRV
jgi:hypothetical protein